MANNDHKAQGADQPTRWLAFFDSDADSGYPSTFSFTWRGFAHSESEAIAKAMKAAEFTLRAFEALDERPSTGAVPFPAAALQVEALPEGYAGREDLTHGLSVAGAPFILPGGAEARFCFDATRPRFKPDRVDYKIAAQVRRMTCWLLLLDPEVSRVLRHVRHLAVHWNANVDALRRPHSLERPYREVGFKICDQDGVAVAVHKSTANAILMLMLSTRGTRADWATFRPFYLQMGHRADVMQGWFEEELRRKQESTRLLANPGRLLGKILLNLFMAGHAELAAHVVALADPNQPRALPPAAGSTRTGKAERAAVPALPSAANLS